MELAAELVVVAVVVAAVVEAAAVELVEVEQAAAGAAKEAMMVPMRKPVGQLPSPLVAKLSC